MPEQLDDKLIEEAITWFVRLGSEECEEQDRAAFDRWLKQSELHQQAYQRAQDLWGKLDGLQDLPNKRKKPRTGKSKIPPIFFAIILSSFGYFIWQNLHQNQQTFQTALGQRRTVKLDDGTLLHINTGSELSVEYSDQQRKVILKQGEASFKVRHDEERPFRVYVGSLKIEDIGTDFDVNLRPEGVWVAVTEGAVQLDDGKIVVAEVLSAGHRRLYSNTHQLGPQQAVDSKQVQAWEKGLLVFKQTPLSEVTTELMRYHPVKFVITSQKLARTTLTGTFASDDLEPFLKALTQILKIKVEHNPNATIVLREKK